MPYCVYPAYFRAIILNCVRTVLMATGGQASGDSECMQRAKDILSYCGLTNDEIEAVKSELDQGI